jgi:hypothetical protein
MTDFGRWTALELHEATGLSRSTVYAHLKIAVALEIMRREGSTFWYVNPVEAMDRLIPKALKIMPNPHRLKLTMSVGEETFWIERDEGGRYRLYGCRGGLATYAVQETDRVSDVDLR